MHLRMLIWGLHKRQNLLLMDFTGQLNKNHYSKQIQKKNIEDICRIPCAHLGPLPVQLSWVPGEGENCSSDNCMTEI